jgi:hypothetical protein
MIKLGHVRYLEELTVYAKSGCNVRLKTADVRIKRPEIPDVQVVP